MAVSSVANETLLKRTMIASFDFTLFAASAQPAGTVSGPVWQPVAPAVAMVSSSVAKRIPSTFTKLVMADWAVTAQKLDSWSFSQTSIPWRTSRSASDCYWFYIVFHEFRL